MTREQALQIFSQGFEAFRLRNDLTQDQVGRILGCGRANVNKIKSGKNFPSMEGVFTLIENGMTLDEIFGPELAAKLLNGNTAKAPDVPEYKPLVDMDSPEFRAGVEKILRDLEAKGYKVINPLK